MLVFSTQLNQVPLILVITSELRVVCAVVEMNANEYDVISPSTVLKELQQVPVVSFSVVGLPLTHSMQ